MRTRCLLGIIICASCSLQPAAAEEAVAVVASNNLLIFDTGNPGTTTIRPVTGLGTNETIRGIDYFATTGDLLACTVTTGSASNSIINAYRINPATGEAVLLGSAGAIAGAADVPTGFDNNPTVGRLRYVNTNDENCRVNAFNGTLAGNDPDLTPAATTDIIAAAYDRNTLGSTTTTLYVIDRNSSSLAIGGGINGTPSPNGGVVTDLCPIGITLDPVQDGGFDVSLSGVAYAALTNNATGLTGLFTLTLPTAVTSTPCATFQGNIGDGTTPVFSLTILPPDTDGDGVRDSLDGCPTDPAKTAAGICGCGTADTDTDGDLTADCNDGCPNDAAKTEPGICGCGVSDVDTDTDGTPDCNDRCPNDAAKIAPESCGCGAVETDTDEDGTADCIDGCPNDPAKTVAGACGCGAAETDTDGDGTADCVDGCPNDPGKSEPGACGCDVADTDADGNGTPDCLDSPLTPTTGCGACGPTASGILLCAASLIAISRTRHRPKTLTRQRQ